MRSLVVFCLVVGVATAVQAQGLHDKIQARKKEAQKPKALAGAVTFQVPRGFDDAFEKAVGWVNHQDYAIDSGETRKEIGQIVTAVAQTGSGYNQTGRRLRITVIKDDDKTTTLKVIVEDLKRKKLFGAEPWSDGTVNQSESAAVADKLKALLGAS
jgi:hypothetical protein